ncbi:TetR/AcrR family transcriptional regulator [Oceanobacillus bengalensis]|uniref:TetR/AcrR family transcriptional regulator n=1 Tax=Oceanobacillus bengalensis TaxID=1435466 RepID=A0A494Z7K8_9BACI|nr:TetR/AcrR family transcriptional regulator [Oceanobacillus bengalensis]RKQ18575.1 TetR/AcrR family transcriptional regulator [Oceanobacillus bengalensis]
MVEFQLLDRRVHRSKHALCNALFDLLEQNKYDHISIKDIIVKAGYSRGTFYSHYRNKDDLLYECIESLFDKMVKSYRNWYIDKDLLNIKEFHNEPLTFLSHMKQYGRYYQILLGKNVQIDFRQKITEVLLNLFVDDFEYIGKSEQNPLEQSLLNRYCGYGVIGVILEWINEDFPTSPQKLSEELVKTMQTPLGNIRIKRKSQWNSYYYSDTIS